MADREEALLTLHKRQDELRQLIDAMASLPAEPPADLIKEVVEFLDFTVRFEERLNAEPSEGAEGLLPVEPTFCARLGNQLAIGIVQIRNKIELELAKSASQSSATDQPRTENHAPATQEARIFHLCRLLPHHYREAITGDLLEDCHAYMDSGVTEKQIRRHVSWEMLRAVTRSWSAVLVTTVKRVFSTK